MARSLLNTFSTVQIVVMFVLGSVALAIALAVAIRRLVPDIAERQFEELASGLRVVYELLFALILAFVIASVLDKFNDAEKTVGSEATALAQMLRNDLAFPANTQESLSKGVSAYVQAVVHDEWPTMRHGESSPEAAASLESLYALYAGFTPRAGPQTEFYDQALAHLDDVATARRDRLALSNAKLPTFLVIMLPVGVLLLLILEYRPRLGPRSQAGFMGTLALVLSSTYLLTIVLDYPFSGDVSVSNEPLTSGALASLVGTTPRKPQPGDKQLKLTDAALVGIWNSDAYGVVALRRTHGELRGTYRLADGTVRGKVGRDGVFHGVWCEHPTRKPGHSNDTSDAGLVEWRQIETADGKRLVAGTWSYGYARRRDGSFRPDGSWDLEKLRIDRALDLVRRIRAEHAGAYCHAPPARTQR
ncbi:MAG: hypothetical protein QOE31_646 [Solirubrobacteraceae bacterium]|nr:hypothetical protein [Solirubrobacteraceae bacterium]